MSTVPHDRKKLLAEELSELMLSAGTIKCARFLTMTACGSERPRGIDCSTDAHDGRIGIWQRKDENGRLVFTRDLMKVAEWRHWANIGKIEAKTQKLRILLLGESVARGYLYDPIYTPALVLEEILKTALGSDEVEVVDLARTTISFEIEHVATAAVALRPDVAVMFCGNNWRSDCPIKPKDLVHASALVSQFGTPGLKCFAVENLKKQAEDSVAAISAAYAREGIPLVWVVPEFNLDDWRDPIINAPFLFDGLNVEWLRLRREAENALIQSDFLGCSQAASEMVTLDGGTTACGLYLLAEANKRTGNVMAARSALSLARDASIWDTSTIYAPRTFEVTQDVLRRRSAIENNTVVDLASLFSTFNHGGLPDRKLFLDYCHLTSEGIKLTMAAVASNVLRTVKGGELEWEQLLKLAPSPSTKTEAEARFLAAIHNAHEWQSPELVQYFALDSIEKSVHVQQSILSYIQLQTRRAPMLMSTPAENIVNGASEQIQHYLVRYNSQQLDYALIAALMAALKKAGIDIQHDLEQLRVEEHAFEGAVIDLLDYYYNSSAGQAHEIGWETPLLSYYVPCQHHYYRAFSQESRFVFVASGSRAAKATLVYRLPCGISTDQGASLYLNDSHLGNVPSTPDWSTCVIEIPSGVMLRGVNWVNISWPTPDVEGNAGIGAMANDLLCGRTISAYTPFGEVHQFLIEV